MKIWPDCIPCILKMSLGIARVVMKDKDQVRRFMEEILKFNLLQFHPGKGFQVRVPVFHRGIPRR
jgi:uncharacterized protein with ATP-grasp and redox domains